MTFFLKIDFTAMLTYAYPRDVAIITLKSLLKWAAKICSPLKWATARKRLRNTGLDNCVENLDDLKVVAFLYFGKHFSLQRRDTSGDKSQVI